MLRRVVNTSQQSAGGVELISAANPQNSLITDIQISPSILIELPNPRRYN